MKIAIGIGVNENIFCLKAKDAGYKIYCDPTVDVWHIGEFIF